MGRVLVLLAIAALAGPALALPSGVPAKKAATAVAGLRLRGGESAFATLFEENPLLPYLCGSLVAAGAGAAAWFYYNQDPGEACSVQTHGLRARAVATVF